LESVERVSGVIKAVEEGVIKTRTSAPALTNKRVSMAALYAAILPDIPMMIFFPLMGIPT